MRNLVLGLMLGVALFVTGCEKVEKGDYKEGTYFGYVEETSYGKVYVTSANIYVDKNGMIKSVFIDSTYVKDDKNTTKKALGDAYNMKPASPIKKEWDEQVEILENKIIEEQGLDWITWKDDTKKTTDSVSGVTLNIDAMYKAVDNALKQAK